MACCCCDGVISGNGGEESSSEGDVRAVDVALLKLNFHFEGFLVTTGAAVAATGTGAEKEGIDAKEGCDARVGAGDVAAECEELREYRAVGMGYMDTGSYGSWRRARADSVVEAFVDIDLTEWCDETLDALLISLARDCEATAKVARVSS